MHRMSARPRRKALRRAACALLPLVATHGLAAEITLPPISLGASIRTGFSHHDAEAGEDIDDFALNSARLHISGKATEQISLMFNTEYNGDTEEVRVIDAVAQFSLSERFNLWAGRFLPPSDRANLYGPYYANNWAIFRDGVQAGYPFEIAGRDDGIMYWGQFGIAKVSLGAFDVQGLTKEDSDVLYAGRVQLDFWDPEPGHYLNGTYYGAKDLLAIGLATQTARGDNAYSADFLLEKKLAGGGALDIEAEYANYDGLGGYPSPLGQPYQQSDGYYVLGAYLLPRVVGLGRFQLLAKYGEATFEFATAGDVEQRTSEVDVNYIIRNFNARLSLYWLDTRFDPATGRDFSELGFGVQVRI